MKSIYIKGELENQEWMYSLVGHERIADGQSAFNDLAMMQVFGIEYFGP